MRDAFPLTARRYQPRTADRPSEPRPERWFHHDIAALVCTHPGEALP